MTFHLIESASKAVSLALEEPVAVAARTSVF